jgi:UDP-N-acetylenolpyruvoylglucosamine reductase
MYITLKESHPDLVGHPVDSSPLVKEGLGEIWQLIKLSAGQLIDLSGLKGLDRWSVGTYHHHALILIHSWWGKGENIVELCHYIQEKVFEKFKVLIEPEVNFID